MDSLQFFLSYYFFKKIEWLLNYKEQKITWEKKEKVRKKERKLN
jgi:hypothetical protein